MLLGLLIGEIADDWPGWSVVGTGAIPAAAIVAVRLVWIVVVPRSVAFRGVASGPTLIVIVATLLMQGVTLMPLVQRLGVGQPGREEREERIARTLARRAGIVAATESMRQEAGQGGAPVVRTAGPVRRGPGRRHAHLAALRVPRAHRSLGAGGGPGVCHSARPVRCAESRRAGAAHGPPGRQGRDRSVGHVRRPDGGHRDRGPARVPGPGCWSTSPTQDT